MYRSDLSVEWRAQLFAAVRSGAALAALAIVPGCGGESNVEPVLGGNGGQPSTTEALDPLPVEQLGCFGEDYGETGFGYHYQCCTTQRCYTPKAGESCAPVEQMDSTLRPPGSGTCGCGDETHPPVAGPYAFNPAAPAQPDGSCCYVIGSISCDGRPVVIDGAPRLAPIVARADWASWA